VRLEVRLEGFEPPAGCLEGGLGHRSGQCEGWSETGSMYSRLAASRPGRRPHRARIGHTAREAIAAIRRIHAELAQCVARLLSILLSARVCGLDSIQVIAPPSASHAAQMASSPQLTTAGLPIAGQFPGPPIAGQFAG